MNDTPNSFIPDNAPNLDALASHLAASDSKVAHYDTTPLRLTAAWLRQRALRPQLTRDEFIAEASAKHAAMGKFPARPVGGGPALAGAHAAADLLRRPDPELGTIPGLPQIDRALDASNEALGRAGEAVGRFAQDVGHNIAEQGKAAIKDPVGTIVGMGKGLVEGAIAPVTTIVDAVQILRGQGAAGVLQRLPKVNSRELRDRGWSEEQIQNALDQREKVVADLVEDMNAESGVVRDRAANGAGLYLSLITGGAAGAATKAAGPLVSGAASGSAGLSTFSGAHALGTGASPRDAAVAAAAGAVIGAGFGAAHAPAAKLASIARLAIESGKPAPRLVPEVPADSPAEGAQFRAPDAPIGDVKLSPAEVNRYIYDTVRQDYLDQHGLTGEQLTALIEGTATAEAQAAALAKGVSVAHIDALRELVAPEARARSASPSPAAAPAPSPVADAALVKKFVEAVEAVRPVTKARAAEISLARSERIGKAKSMLKSGNGREGFEKARGALKGEIQVGEGLGAVAEQFTSAEVDQLFNMVARANITPFEKIRAGTALAKIMEPGGTKIPQRGELALLTEVFGKDMTNAIVKSKGRWAQVRENAFGAIAAPRALMSSFDFSAFGRQGALMVTRPEFWKAIVPSVKAFGSEKVYQAIRDDIRARPSYHAMRESGLAMLEHTPEEAFPKTLQFVENLPNVKMGQRAYNGFLHKIRADIFDSVRRDAQRSGVEVGEKFDKSLATWINTFTGRGELGRFEPSADLLNQTLFAPRLVAARMQVFNPMFYGKLDPFVRKQAIQTVIASGSAAATLLALASLGGKQAGITVNMDPRSSDFAKIRKGSTRWDILAGHQQVIKLAAQLASGTAVSSSGRETDLSGKDRGRNRFDTALTFVESKLQPVASLIVSALKGTDFRGQPINWTKEALDRALPLLITDTIEAVRVEGPVGAAYMIPGVVGVGVQTYTPDAGFTRKGTTYRIEGKVSEQYASDLKDATSRAIIRVMEIPGYDKMAPAQQEALMKRLLDHEVDAVKGRWLDANKDAIEKAARIHGNQLQIARDTGKDAPESVVKLVSAPEQGPGVDAPSVADAEANLAAARQELKDVREGRKSGDLARLRARVASAAKRILGEVKKLSRKEQARVGFELRQSKRDEVPASFVEDVDDVPSSFVEDDEVPSSFIEDDENEQDADALPLTGRAAQQLAPRGKKDPVLDQRAQ